MKPEKQEAEVPVLKSHAIGNRKRERGTKKRGRERGGQEGGKPQARHKASGHGRHTAQACRHKQLHMSKEDV